MRVVLINGSPKSSNSASGILLADLKKSILACNAEKREIGIKEIIFHHASVSEEAMKELKKADVWVFACPLYVDGIPSHLLSCLLQMEKLDWKENETYVYCIVNCGFYEGIQAEYALDIIQNWCIKTGLNWCGGIGVGGGGSLGQLPEVKGGHGPKAPVDKALGAMAGAILQHDLPGKMHDNRYVSVALPRFLYKMAAHMGWRQMIKANGGTIRELGNRPE